MNTHEENKRLVEMARRANTERYEAHSRETLKKHITTKFRTTMIGTLAIIEEQWGYLWGHGLPEEELTDSQSDARKEWEVIRTEILNNGNNQMRAALAEIEQYTVKYNKKEYNFLIKDSKELTRNE